MKNLLIFFIILGTAMVTFSGCQNNVTDPGNAYEEITFHNMRETAHPYLEVIDSIMGVVIVGPNRQDTTGLTKILLNGSKIYEKEWPRYSEYSSPVTIDQAQNNIRLVMLGNRQIIILADKKPTWFETILVIEGGNVKTHVANVRCNSEKSRISEGRSLC
jgi:hypothetical protein